MTRYLIITFALLLSALSLRAQIYKSSQLIGSKWMCIQAEGDTIYMEFSAKVFHYKRTINGKSMGGTCQQYYLSPIKPLVFDFTKVGTNSNGKYIVYYNEEFKEFTCDEIKYLYDDNMLIYLDYDLADEAFKELFCYKRYKRIK
ncbi:MAG: hypothetical protein KBS99_08805 [Prevotellaceae bacterium]|nr:hypothetical protein [Candidatus Colivivens caballi]